MKKELLIVTSLVFITVIYSYRDSAPLSERDTSLTQDRVFPSLNINEWFHLNSSQSIFWNNDEVVFVGSMDGQPVNYSESVIIRFSSNGDRQTYKPERKSPKIHCLNQGIILYSAIKDNLRTLYRGRLGKEIVYKAEGDFLDKNTCSFIKEKPHLFNLAGKAKFEYGEDLTPSEYRYKDFWWPDRELLFSSTRSPATYEGLGIPESKIANIQYIRDEVYAVIANVKGRYTATSSNIELGSFALLLNNDGTKEKYKLPNISSANYQLWKRGFVASIIPAVNYKYKQRGIYVHFGVEDTENITNWYRAFYGNVLDLIVSEDGCFIVYSGESLISRGSGAKENRFISIINLCDIDESQLATPLKPYEDIDFKQQQKRRSVNIGSDRFYRVGDSVLQVPSRNVLLAGGPVLNTLLLKHFFEDISLELDSKSKLSWKNEGVYPWVVIELRERRFNRKKINTSALALSKANTPPETIERLGLLKYENVKLGFSETDYYVPIEKITKMDGDSLTVACSPDKSMSDRFHQCNVGYMISDRVRVTYKFIARALPYWKEIHSSVTEQVNSYLEPSAEQPL